MMFGDGLQQHLYILQLQSRCHRSEQAPAPLSSFSFVLFIVLLLRGPLKTTHYG